MNYSFIIHAFFYRNIFIRSMFFKIKVKIFKINI